MIKMLVGALMIFIITFSTFIISNFSNDTFISNGRVHLHKPIILPIDSSVLENNTLLFLGYVGCPDICTPRMFEIQKIYEEYNKLNDFNNLNVLFISLKDDEDTELADQFAKSFNQNFMGITPSKKSTFRLVRTLNAYFARSLTDKEVIDHTDALYLIKKGVDGTTYLENIYMQSKYNQEVILNDVTKDK